MARHPSRPRASRSQPSARTLPKLELGICLGLLAAVLIVYLQAAQFDFVNYDDPEYVTSNAMVQSGLSWGSIKWAFTASVAGNWMPVTLMSHMLDCQLFGLESGAHHFINVLLHAITGMLLFLCLRRMTGNVWPSAFVAFVFAAHPLHVESVAWVAERKDVLFAMFFFLALYVYVLYAERSTPKRYIAVTLLFCLGLMSKPMMVTFPFVLVLLDWWPLRRPWSWKLIIEKVPWIVLSALVSVVTWRVQASGGAVQETIPLPLRLSSAAASYIGYLWKMIWPAGLAVFYPYRTVAAWEVLGSVLLLAAVTAAVFYLRATRPYLLTGWLWYLGTLVPVIGVVQAGSQAMADRYTYLPSIGISIMVAWGAAEWINRSPRVQNAVMGLTAIASVLMMVTAHAQAGYWANSGTLFQHAIDVTRDNYEAQKGLGMYLAQTGRPAEAIPHFEEVVRLIPTDAQMHNNLGILLAQQPGRQDEALAQFEAAVKLHPDFAAAQHNLAIALSQIPGREREALAHYEAAQRVEPNAERAQRIDELKSRLGVAR